MLRALGWAALAIYTVAFVELFIRIFDPQPVMPRYITGTAWGVRGNIPNARYWIHTPEVDVPYRINAEGMRADREYPFAKPPGTCRVALFGDSFFFGVEVDLPDSIAGQLEKRLNRAGFRAEVLNFAVGGFGTAEMLQTYEKFGRRFDPDVVIFSWDSSDLYDNVRAGLFRLDGGELQRAGTEYLPGVRAQDALMRIGLYRLIADHSQFYSFIRERINAFVKLHMVTGRAVKPDVGSSQPDGEEPDANDLHDMQKRNAVELSSALLLRAHDEVTSMGHDFYLLEIPARKSRVQFGSTAGILAPAVLTQIKAVSPVAALTAAARPDLKLYFEKGQGHFTPKGVEIVVDELFGDLASSPQLTACATVH